MQSMHLPADGSLGKEICYLLFLRRHWFLARGGLCCDVSDLLRTRGAIRTCLVGELAGVCRGGGGGVEALRARFFGLPSSSSSSSTTSSWCFASPNVIFSDAETALCLASKDDCDDDDEEGPACEADDDEDLTGEADLAVCFLNIASRPSLRSATGLTNEASLVPTFPTSGGT